MYCTNIIELLHAARTIAQAELRAALEAHDGAVSFPENDRPGIDLNGRMARVKSAYLVPGGIMVDVLNYDGSVENLPSYGLKPDSLCHLTNRIPPAPGKVESVRGTLLVGDIQTNAELSFRVGEYFRPLFDEAGLPARERWRIVRDTVRGICLRWTRITQQRSTCSESVLDEISDEEFNDMAREWKRKMVEENLLGPLRQKALAKYAQGPNPHDKALAVLNSVWNSGRSSLSLLNDIFGESVLKHVKKLENDGFVRLDDDGIVVTAYGNLKGCFE